MNRACLSPAGATEHLSDNVQVFSHKLEAVHQGTGPSLLHKSSQELLT